jgi:hypothetical protein
MQPVAQIIEFNCKVECQKQSSVQYNNETVEADSSSLRVAVLSKMMNSFGFWCRFDVFRRL